MNVQPWIIVAALIGSSGVALGAYHTHGLEKNLAKKVADPEELRHRIDQFGAGTRYQMYHAAALVGLIGLSVGQPSRWTRFAAALLTVGIVLFSGSLYALALTGTKIFAHIAPIGGLTLIAAWLSMTGIAMQYKCSLVGDSGPSSS